MKNWVDFIKKISSGAQITRTGVEILLREYQMSTQHPIVKNGSVEFSINESGSKLTLYADLGDPDADDNYIELSPEMAPEKMIDVAFEILKVVSYNMNYDALVAEIKRRAEKLY
jgi:hypothetical protein